MKCQLCESEFKTQKPLEKHQTRKTACISSEKVINLLNEKDKELSEMKERMDMSEEQSDMFRKLHVRSQKQLAAWRKEHKKCDVTRAKEALEEPEYPPGPRKKVSVEEFFNNPENFSSPEEAAANSTSSSFDFGQNANTQPSNNGTTTSFSFKQSNDTNNRSNSDSGTTFSFRPKSTSMPTPKLNQPDSIKPPTSWSSWSNNNNNSSFPNWSSGNNNFSGSKFGTKEWAKNFGKQMGNQLARLPNGQMLDTTNMTTTNTTTTNITNNIININVKICAPGFESIQMKDSRGLNFSMAKKQKIADHLQKLLEIMMEEEQKFE
jgi:hypothetical protein